MECLLHSKKIASTLLKYGRYLCAQIKHCQCILTNALIFLLVPGNL